MCRPYWKVGGDNSIAREVLFLCMYLLCGVGLHEWGSTDLLELLIFCKIAMAPWSMDGKGIRSTFKIIMLD